MTSLIISFIANKLMKSENFAQNATFYLICPIGFEKLVQNELKLKLSIYFPHAEVKIKNIEVGGVEIESDFSIGLSLNSILKVPTRILFRIKTQICRDYPKLYKIIKKINWKEFLLQENVTILASAKQSRLIHSRRIEETALEAIQDYFKANHIKESLKEKKAPLQKIYLRLNDNHLTVSLDTSGELLHKRSPSGFRGHAGLRENYASGLLYFLLGEKQYHDITLIDPMCGSGTFLREAKNFFALNPNHFSFNYWNIQKPTVKEIDEKLWNFKKIKGHDIDAKIVGANNSEDITQKDFFKSSYKSPCIIIFNPPYGKRVKIKGDPKAFFEGLIKHIKESYNWIKIGILIPQSYSKFFRPSQKISLNQNGIKVDFLVFNRK